jgi:arylsulfatase A-like enzyme
VAYNDDRLEALVGELERRFDAGELLLIVTSDHGEEFFEHGGVLHGHTLYDEMLHIPLVFWWPTVLEHRRVNALTGTLDVHATLMKLVDGRLPFSSEGGESLWGMMLGSGAEGRRLRFAFATGGRRVHMARSDAWKLILAPNQRLEWGMGHGRGESGDAEYAFSLLDDPQEGHNLAGSSALELAWLRSRLLAWVATWNARQKEIVRTEVDQDTQRRLEALGYTE